MKKRVLGAILAIVIMVGILPFGTITVSAAPLIYTAQDLYDVRNNLSGSYTIMNDIDLSSWGNWTPIGNSSTPFKGTFNGNGKSIRGLKINTSSDNQGLFGYMSGGTVRNVTLTESNISGRNTVGGIVGHIESGVIEDCKNYGTISGGANVGGIVGQIDAWHRTVRIRNCYNRGNIKGTGSSTGGILGRSHAYGDQAVIDVESCYNSGNIEGASSVGGIVGTSTLHGLAPWGRVNVINCYNTGNVKGTSSVGGIVGSNITRVSNCYNVGAISGNSNTSSIVGSKNEFAFGGSTIRGSIGSCYYLSTTPADSSATSRTQQQMKQQSMFSGFNFTTIWGIDPKINNGYPYLRTLGANGTDGLMQNIVSVVALQNGTEVPVNDAIVTVYNGIDAMGTDDVTVTSIGNGQYYLNWRRDVPQNASIVAYKNIDVGDANKGFSYQRNIIDTYFGGEKWNLRLYSNQIQNDGSFSTQSINSKDAIKLTLARPHIVLNLSVAYDSSLSPSKVLDIMNEADRYLLEATDGYFSMNNICISPVVNKDYFKNTNHFAGQADIRFDDTTNAGNTPPPANAHTKGYYENVKTGFGNVSPRIQLFCYNTYSADYTSRAIVHEMGHYILGLYDEYMNGDGKKFGDKKLFGGNVQRPSGAPSTFGVMDAFQFVDMEMSKSSDYSYLPSNPTKSDMTIQYKERLSSCWDFLAQQSFWASNLNVEYNYAFFAPPSISSRTYTGYKSNLNYIVASIGISRVMSFSMANSSDIDMRFAYAGVNYVNNEYSVTLNLISPSAVASSSTLKLYVVDFYDNRTEIPIIKINNVYQGTVSINEDDWNFIEAMIEINDIIYTNKFDVIVSGLQTEDESHLLISPVTSIYSLTTDEPDQTIITINRHVSDDISNSIQNSPRYITTKYGKTIVNSTLMESCNGDADLTTVSWSKYNGDEWQNINTELEVGEHDSIKAYANYFDAGFYAVTAEPARSDTIQKITGLAITPNNTSDGLTMLQFVDNNMAEDLIGYYVYYSDQPFTDINESGVYVQFVEHCDEEILINVVKPNATYYFAIIAKGINGAASPVSDVASGNTGERKTMGSNIPQWWVDQYNLQNYNEEIVDDSDPDKDGLTNYNEYLFGTNPLIADTDDDGVDDGVEISLSLNPLNPKTDGATPDAHLAYGNIDLVISDFKIESDLTTFIGASNFTIKATVQNHSSVDVKNIPVELFMDNNLIYTYTMDIVSNQAKEIAYFAENTNKPSNIKIVVDGKELFSDTNRTNNIFEIELKNELTMSINNAVSNLNVIKLNTQISNYYSKVTGVYLIADAYKDNQKIGSGFTRFDLEVCTSTNVDTILSLPENISGDVEIRLSLCNDDKGTTQISSDTEQSIVTIQVPEISSETDFQFNASTQTITKYVGTGGVVIIPDSINGVAVSAIGTNAFSNNANITGIVSPGTVKKIENNAFYYCTNLLSVIIKDGCEYIGQTAFYYCNNLLSISIPASVNEIDYYAFSSTPWHHGLQAEFCIVGNNILIKYNGNAEIIEIPMGVRDISGDCFSYSSAHGITKKIVLPDSLEKIGNQAFEFFYMLESINIPNSVKIIGDGAFMYTGLKEVKIPSSVEQIGNYAFADNFNLESVYISGRAPLIGQYAFGWDWNDTNLILYKDFGASGFESSAWSQYRFKTISPVHNINFSEGILGNCQVKL